MSGNRRKNSQSQSNRPLPPEDEPRLVVMPKDEPQDDAVDEAQSRPAQRPLPQSATRAKTERIGDMLREARLHHNGDLYEIAEYLCIKPNFLVALENSAYEKLPADAYVIGFLRTYANFLGLDGKEAVDRYRYEMAGRRKKPTLAMPTPLTEGHMPSGIIMVGVTVAVLLIYVLWYGVSSSNRTEVVTPQPLSTVVQPSADSAAGMTAPVQSADPAVPASTAPVAPVVPATSVPATTAPSTSGGLNIPPEAPGIVVSGLPQAMPAPSAKEIAAEAAKAEKAEKEKAAAKSDAPKSEAAKVETAKLEAAKVEAAKSEAAKDEKKDEKAKPSAGGKLVIRALQSSWVMVTDSNGKAVFDGVLKPGETYAVPDRQGLSLTTGNGSGIVLSMNGTELPKIAGGAPRVVRNIPLDPDRLAAGTAGQ